MSLLSNCHFRKENKDLLQRTLSDEARQRRSHRNKTSLKISFLSWLVEFITGVVVIIDYFGSVSDSNFYQWMYWITGLDVFLCGVVVPSAYILNTEAIKECLNNLGWVKTFRKFYSRNDARVFPRA